MDGHPRPGWLGNPMTPSPGIDEYDQCLYTTTVVSPAVGGFGGRGVTNQREPRAVKGVDRKLRRKPFK
ncbi:hypothetical protein ACLOJK_034363, partial [Asimina triloba]